VQPDSCVAGVIFVAAILTAVQLLPLEHPPLACTFLSSLAAGVWFARRTRSLLKRLPGVHLSLCIWYGAAAVSASIWIAFFLSDLAGLGCEAAYRYLYFRLDVLPWAPAALRVLQGILDHLVAGFVAVPVGLVAGPVAGVVCRWGGVQRLPALPVLLVIVLLAVAAAGGARAFLGEEQAWQERGRTAIRIAPGSFTLGTKGWQDDEGPPHPVDLAGYEIDVHEVTIRQYWTFVSATGHRWPPGWDDPGRPFTVRPHEPVDGVAWEDADAYAAFVGRRLPTEAEWERAARGSRSHLYPWGDVFDRGLMNGGEKPCRMESAGEVNRAPHSLRPACYGEPGNHPVPVGSYRSDRSEAGLMDVAGNVAEWVADWYAADAYRRGAANGGPRTGTERVYRGGDYGGATQTSARLTRRYHAAPGVELWGKGFRTARTLAH
jgi:sulfatase modifying factor 1